MVARGWPVYVAVPRIILCNTSIVLKMNGVVLMIDGDGDGADGSADDDDADASLSTETPSCRGGLYNISQWTSCSLVVFVMEGEAVGVVVVVVDVR